MNTQTAIFGGGCFWCMEAVFQRLRGVTSVLPGYAGGTIPNPTYGQVSSGTTGHAEVAEVKYDPTQIMFQDLLNVFFSLHNPTTLNRQGNDVGTQYRSAVFTTTPEQLEQTTAYIQKLTSDQVFPDPIVTDVKPLDVFYPAEDYHRNYYNANSSEPYCQVVINPKIAKLRKSYSHLLKE